MEVCIICTSLHSSLCFSCIQFVLLLFFLVPQTVPELIVNPLNPVSLHIEWSAINGNLASGAVTQYHILWRRSHSVSNYVHVLHKSIRKYTVTGNK